MDDGESEQRSQFEQLGSDEVRLLLNGNRFSAQNKRWAIRWLAERDQEEARRKDVSQAEQIEVARSAKDAAWAAAKAAERAAAAAETANRRATIALALAAISILATIILGVLSHWDASKSLPHS